MITKISDLTAAERGSLAYDARNMAHAYEDPRYNQELTAEQRQEKAARWQEIAAAFESGGKEPHGIEPGVSTPLPLTELAKHVPIDAADVSPVRRWLDENPPLATAGTGGPMLTVHCALHSRDSGEGSIVSHLFTESEGARLLVEMSAEDWEDGPRCLRHYLDRVADGQWGYRPILPDGGRSDVACGEHEARRKAYADHFVLLTYRPRPDAPWEDVGHWGPGGHRQQPVFHRMAAGEAGEVG
jgi:hypothetical protein